MLRYDDWIRSKKIFFSFVQRNFFFFSTGQIRVIKILWRQEIFLFCKTSCPIVAPTQRVTWFFSEDKTAGRVNDHQRPSGAELKKEWSYTSAPSCAFVAWTETLPFLCTCYWRSIIPVRRSGHTFVRMFLQCLYFPVIVSHYYILSYWEWLKKPRINMSTY